MNISRRIGAAIWVALLLAAHDVGNASEPSAPSSRAHLVELSDEFQVLYAAADYQAALPVAREMVALLEPGVGLERELAGAYERLARVEIATGDAVAAARICGCAETITFLSTGGGAALAYISRQPLPGIEALQAP